MKNAATGDDTVLVEAMSYSRTPGSYLLLMHLTEPREIAVGKLGSFTFPIGWYVYAAPI